MAIGVMSKCGSNVSVVTYFIPSLGSFLYSEEGYKNLTNSNKTIRIRQHKQKKLRAIFYLLFNNLRIFNVKN